MENSTPIFSSQRRRLLEAYKGANQEVVAHTIPYHSTGVIPFEVVNWTTTPSPGVAFAVCRRNTSIQFFTYGVGQQVNLGGTGNKRATEAETNQAQGGKTNGAQDFVIEGIGFHCRGARQQFTGASLVSIDALVTDPDLELVINGDVPFYDPAAIMSPPQLQSPFNLEQGMFQALLGQSSVQLLFDRKRVEKIGTLDLLPQAGAQSYLRANGSPESTNRYCIPEGYLWRKDGQADCDLQIDVVVQNTLVVPISGTTLWNTGPADVTPTTIWLEVVMRLFGLAIDMPSQN
jgi:hypothetical protein